MNKVIIIGNLTRDPELTQTPSGKSVCNLSVAVNREFAEGETDYFNVKVRNKQAETCDEWLVKGRKVGVVGRLQNRSYEDKDGVKRTVTEVIAESVEFLSTNQVVRREDVSQHVEAKPVMEEIDDNQLPF